MQRVTAARPPRLEYQVWAVDPTFVEEAPSCKVVARFSYLQEAIDYCSSVVRAPVVLTGAGKEPTGYSGKPCAPGERSAFFSAPRLEWDAMPGEMAAGVVAGVNS